MFELFSISGWRCAVGVGALALAGCGGGVDSVPAHAGGGSAGTSGSSGSGAVGGNASGGHAGSVASGGTGGSGGAGATGSGGTSGSGGLAGSAGCTSSPSGYACDPWSVFLYPTDGAHRDNASLHVQVHHDVDLEGNPNDEVIAPGHDFSQVLSVDIELTPEVRSYLCSVLVPAATSASFDPSKPDFSASVSQNLGASLLSPLPNDFYPHPENVLAICGAGPLTPIVAPALVSTPTLPDIVLVLPLQPKPLDFKVGDTFSAWLALGILFVDEQSELTPQVTATIAEIL